MAHTGETFATYEHWRLALAQSKIAVENLQSELSVGLHCQALYTTRPSTTWPCAWPARTYTTEVRDAHDVDALAQELAAQRGAGLDGLWLSRLPNDVSPKSLTALLTAMDESIALIGVAECDAADQAVMRLVESARNARPHARLIVCRDVFAYFAKTGGLQGHAANDRDLGEWLVQRLTHTELLPNTCALGMDLVPYDHGGASASQLLGIAAATLVSTLRACESAGVSASRAAPHIAATVPMGSKIFVNIAMIRALRRLFQAIFQSCGVQTAVPVFVHAVSSPRTLSRRDVFVNALRSTTHAFSALLGGCDALSIAPCDGRAAHVSANALRLARNTTHIARFESHLDFVEDPTAGSYAIESLTAQLVASGWAMLQAIETRGGLFGALQNGWLQAEIAKSFEHSEHARRTRKSGLVGVSVFAHPNAENNGARNPALVATSKAALAIPAHFDGEAFESLQDAAARFDAPAPVFLVCLGPLSKHGARLDFARGVFAAGNLPCQVGPGTPAELDANTSANTVAAQYEQSGAAIACLCGSDDDYTRLGPTVISALRARGCSMVIIAANPRKLDGELFDADAWIYLGADVVAVLTDVMTTLGARRSRKGEVA